MDKLRNKSIWYFSAILLVLFCVTTCASLEIVAKDCSFTEPIYNVTFNLTGLHSDLDHNAISPMEEQLFFNVCGKLTKKCNNQSDVSACYTKKNGTQIAFNDEKLFLTDGRIHFNYTGGRCNNKANYTLHILLQCDYIAVKNPIILMPYADNECSYFILWTTPSACLPPPKNALDNSCTLTDKPNEYNFMQLSHQNHKVMAPDGSLFYINLCKPVFYGHNTMCPPGSSICHFNGNATDLKDKYHNFGYTSNNIVMEDKIVMRYTSDEKCNATHNISSRIILGCDPNNKFEEPEYMGLINCVHNFLWQTPYACKNTVSCVSETAHGKFDMTELSGKVYNITDNNNSYVFSICKKPANFPCTKNSGSCSSHGAMALGDINDELLFNVTGSPYLVYNSGAACGKTTWSTKIEFICGDDKKSPQIVENKDCMLSIQFETKLACKWELTCTATNITDDSTIDLTPLISSNHNYIANVSKELMKTEGYPIQYFINVCRPLVPQYGLSCPGGTSVCRAKVDQKTPEEEQSLGYPDIELTVADADGKSRAQLKYLRGTKCPTDNSTDMSSVIEFYCKPDAGLGLPVLQYIHDCDYHFEWATNIMCPSHKCEFKQKTCSIFTDELNKTIDLKDIIPKGIINVKDTKNFDINVCDNTNKNILTDYQQSSVKMYFNATGPCDNDKNIKVELRLICRDTVHSSSLSDKATCSLILTRETPLICPFLGIMVPITKHNDTTPENGGNTNSPLAPDNNVDPGISVIGIVLITLAMTTVAGLLVMTLKNPERRAQIMQLFGRRNVAVQYTRVNNDEASLLLQPEAGRLTDSDDELLI